MTTDREARLRQRAHQIWELEGRPSGRHHEHWLQAESELAEEEAVAGTTDQVARWEGPPENRPRGYLPALDDPATTPDATGETLAQPRRSDLSDALGAVNDPNRK